jgi:hypothetical protein
MEDGNLANELRGARTATPEHVMDARLAEDSDVVASDGAVVQEKGARTWRRETLVKRDAGTGVTGYTLDLQLATARSFLHLAQPLAAIRTYLPSRPVI